MQKVKKRNPRAECGKLIFTIREQYYAFNFTE